MYQILLLYLCGSAGSHSPRAACCYCRRWFSSITISIRWRRRLRIYTHMFGPNAFLLLVVVAVVALSPTRKMRVLSAARTQHTHSLIHSHTPTINLFRYHQIGSICFSLTQSTKNRTYAYTGWWDRRRSTGRWNRAVRAQHTIHHFSDCNYFLFHLVRLLWVCNKQRPNVRYSMVFRQIQFTHSYEDDRYNWGIAES